MRLIVVVEGQTEEAFVKDVLGPHLDAFGVYTSATIVGKSAPFSAGCRPRCRATNSQPSTPAGRVFVIPRPTQDKSFFLGREPCR